MRFLLVSCFFLAAIHCNVIEEQHEYISYEDYFDFTCLQEQSELAMEDFFIQYPSLKPSNRADIIKLKRSFVKFMADPQVEEAILGGGYPSEHIILARFVKGLREFVEEEFEELSDEEQEYLGGADDLLLHKLSIPFRVRDIKPKVAEFKQSSMSKEEFAEDVMRKCSSISLKWDMDPSYEAAEQHIFNSPDFEEAFKKWDESNKSEGEIFSIHLDHQTKEKRFDTIKIKREL